MTRARNDAAFTRKHHPAPTRASSTPPSIGPTARATLMPAAFSATASCSRVVGTSAGTSASTDGRPMAKAAPITNVAAKMAATDRCPVHPRMASARAPAASTENVVMPMTRQS